MPAVDLFHLPVDMPQIFLLVFKILLRMLHDHRDKSNRYRKDQKRDQCHQRTDAKHHDQHTDNGRHGSDHLGRTLIQALAQCIHVIGDP